MTTENQETQNEKLVFPMKFDKCPACGSTARVVAMLRDEEAAKGKVPKDVPMVADQGLCPITEMKTVLLGLSIVPVLVFQYDVCPKCGTKYCISIIRKDMPTSELQKLMGIQVAPINLQSSPSMGLGGMNRQQRRHPS